MIKKVSYNDILLLPCKEQSHIFSSWYQRENYHRLKNTICLWFRLFRVFFRHTLAYLGDLGILVMNQRHGTFVAPYTPTAPAPPHRCSSETGVCDLSFDVLAKVGVKHGAKPRKKKMIDWLTTKKAAYDFLPDGNKMIHKRSEAIVDWLIHLHWHKADAQGIHRVNLDCLLQVVILSHS